MKGGDFVPGLNRPVYQFLLLRFLLAICPHPLAGFTLSVALPFWVFMQILRACRYPVQKSVRLFPKLTMAWMHGRKDKSFPAPYSGSLYYCK